MTDDEAHGIAWWNAMSEADRLFWLRAAVTVVPAEAWAYFKRCGAGDRGGTPQVDGHCIGDTRLTG